MDPALRERMRQAHALRAYSRNRLAAAWAACVGAARDGLPARRLEAAVGSADHGSAIAIVEEAMGEAAARFAGYVRDEYHRSMIAEAVHAGGVLDAAARMRKSEIRIDYGRMGLANPASIAAHRGNGLRLVRETVQRERARMGEALSRAAASGANPRATARTIREGLGLTAHQEGILANYEAELRGSPPRMNMRRRLRDRRFDSVLANARRRGRPLTEDQIGRMTGRYRERWLRHRAETIARTEALRSARAGANDMWETLHRDGDVGRDEVRRFWTHVRDGRVRDSHVRTPELNRDGRAIGEPFITGRGGRLMYPGDPAGDSADVINCRCLVTVQPIPRDRRGPPSAAGPSEPPIGMAGHAHGRAGTARAAPRARALPSGIEGPPRARPPRPRPRTAPPESIEFGPADSISPMRGLPAEARFEIGRAVDRSRRALAPWRVREPVELITPGFRNLIDGASEVLFIASAPGDGLPVRMLAERPDGEISDRWLDPYELAYTLGIPEGEIEAGAYDREGNYAR